MTDLLATPFLVIDIETTGLSATGARIIEIGLAVTVGELPPRIVLDTLIAPGRAIPNSEVHGIVDADVIDAPNFAQLIEPIRAAMANRVLASHHADFDRRHLEHAFGAYGLPLFAPWLCTMRLPKLAGFGPSQLPLWWACEREGIGHPRHARHSAAADALATATLLQRYLLRLAARGIHTREQLAQQLDRVGAAEDAMLLRRQPLAPQPVFLATAGDLARPRVPRVAEAPPPIQLYLQATAAVLKDLVVDADEASHLATLRQQLAISPSKAERVYESIWESATRRFGEDGMIDPVEMHHLDALRRGLGVLGWTPPGDA